MVQQNQSPRFLLLLLPLALALGCSDSPTQHSDSAQSDAAPSALESGQIPAALAPLLDENPADLPVLAWDFVVHQLRGPELDRKGSPKEFIEHARSLGIESFTKDAASAAEGLKTNGSMLYDATEGRWLIKVNTTTKWTDGAAPYMSRRLIFAFDGKRYSTSSHDRHGTTLPDTAITGFVSETNQLPLEFTITDKPREDLATASYLHLSGASFLPSYVGPYGKTLFPPTLTADFLKQLGAEKRLINVTENERLVTVTCQDSPPTDPAGALPYTLKFTFDLNRAGLLTNAKLASPNGNLVFDEYFIDSEEIQPGLWVPTQIRRVNWIDQRGQIVELSNVRVVDDISNEDFQVKAPDGATVTDDINKLKFKQDGTQPLDIFKAMEAYSPN